MTTSDLDGTPVSDGPEHFAEAAQAFVDRFTGPLTPHHVAKTLSHLAHGGFIVSAAEHNRRCDEYAALLSHVEQAADDLVRHIHGGDQ